MIRSLYERKCVTFTNPFRFSAIAAFKKARAGEKRNILYVCWANRYLTFSERLKNADAMSNNFSIFSLFAYRNY